MPGSGKTGVSVRVREINSYTYLVISSIASIWLSIEVLKYSEVITLILLTSITTSNDHVTTKLFTHT